MNKHDFKYILRRVLSFFIIFIILSMVKTCEVHAEENIIVGGTENGVYEASPYARFYNNTNGTFTSSTTQVDNEYRIFWTNDTVTSNGYGEGISFDLNTVVAKDMTYVLTIYLASDYNNLYYYYKNSINYPNLLACGNSLGGAAGNFNNGNGILASFQKFSIGSAKIYISELDGDPVYYYGNYLTYIFTANDNCGTMFVPFNAATTTSHYTGYLGYNLYSLGNTSNLTSSDISSAIASSGLATAQSQQQLGYAINSLRSEVESMNAEQEKTNDILTDSSTPSDSQVNQLITSAQTQNVNVSALANFIPATLQVILNGFQNSCTGGYSLGSLYNHELVIPCINPVDYLGSFLWGVIDSILCLCYLIPLCKFLVNKYNDLTSLKNLRWQ